MKTPDGFGQSYNAQAALEIESRLLVGVNVSDAPNDKGQLGPTLAVVSPVIESLEAVLVDSGYYSAAAVAAVEQPSEQTAGLMIYAATGRKRAARDNFWKQPEEVIQRGIQRMRGWAGYFYYGNSTRVLAKLQW
jgi:hypothetical protein